jgi:NAD(P)-dependent dehydrogenase (short-subunit alcohol dehydrogenase family)
MKLGIKNKVAIVTGGATGIGFAIANGLAKEGVNVIISSRNKNSLKDAVLELKRINKNCDGFLIDVSKKNAPKLLVQKVIKKYKHVDILVNNVGDTLNILDPYCSENQWIKLFRLVLGVAIEMNNLVIPYMTKKRWGRIVNITAGASMENSGPVPYSSLKAAFTAYSRSMARVLATEKNNVVMSAVLPGLVLTKRGHWQKVLKERPEHAKKYLKERTTLQRFGYPNEISPMVTLLCSNLASFCIGTIVPVEGGQARHYFQKVDDF